MFCQMIVNIISIQDSCRKWNLCFLKVPVNRDSTTSGRDHKYFCLSLRLCKLHTSEHRIKMPVVDLIKFLDKIFFKNRLRLSITENCISFNAQDLIRDLLRQIDLMK